MVVLSHIVSPCYAYLQLPSFITRVFYTLSYGGTGVSVFFVLSGFLITTILINEKIRTGKISLLKFYMRRALRIWPLYYAVIFFAFGIYPFLKTQLHINQSLSTNVWYHIGFLANFDVLHVRAFFTGNDAMSQNVNWSISVEEQFYLLWPLLFAFFPRKSYAYLIAAVLFVAIGFRIIHNNSFDILYFHTIAVLPDMAIGGLFATLVLTNNKVLSYFERQGSAQQITVLSVLFLLLYFSVQLSTQGYLPSFYRVVVDLLIAYLICSQAYSSSAIKFNAGNWTFASKWGKYTYGIYLLHPIALLIINTSLRALHLTFSKPTLLGIEAGAAVVLTFGLSWLSFHYFESYFLGLKRKFSA